MKRRLYYIMLLAAVSLSGMAQNIGETFYIYRNDGQFNAFMRDEVINIDYSYEDADGNTYNEIVTQIVNTSDSIYKIPLATIDSVSFVQPKTILNRDVFPLTADHSPYISNGDVLSFTMSFNTPENLRPKVGNIVVATAECLAFPNGIIANVESISKIGSGYLYTCSQAYIDDVFEQLVIYQPSLSCDNNESLARHFDFRRASLASTLWDKNWTKTIEYDGCTTTLNVRGRGTASVMVCKTSTTPLFFQLQFQNSLTSDIGFNAQSIASIKHEQQIGQTLTAGRIPIPIPYLPNIFWLEPKLSLFGYFEEQGKVELNYSGHYNRIDNLTFTYTQGVWTFDHKPITDIGTDVTSLNMDGSAEIGLKPQIDFSLNGQQAGFGMSGRAGLKEYINFVFDATRLSDGGLYDAMRDSYCRTTIPWSITVHANANVFSRYNANSTDEGLATFSHTFAPKEEPRWGNDRYIFPLFSNVEGKWQDSKATVKASVSRTPLLPVQVGFSLINMNKNIVATTYDSRSYMAGSTFNNYSCEFTGMESSGSYTVAPSVKLFGQDILASPSAELERQEFPIEINDFKQIGSEYKKDGFSYNGKTYSYKYDCTVTVILKDNKDVEDWGYVYQDPFGNPPTRISLKGYGSPYTDTRYSYYRNESSSTVTLYEYVRYTGDSDYYYGEPQNYQVSHKGYTSCPVAITSFEQISSNSYILHPMNNIYEYDCIVTVELTDAEGVEDWGFVYQNPLGTSPTKISLREFNSPYIDTYKFSSINPNSSITIYEYASIGGKYYYGESKDYQLSYEFESFCPDSNHPHVIDLGLPSGTKWSCCNLGALKPEEKGSLYSWGETSDKPTYNKEDYLYLYTDIGSNIAGTIYDAASVCWGGSWRMPSISQCRELSENCSYKWIRLNGMDGGLFTGPNGKSIFIPCTNYYYENFRLVGKSGFFWSSNVLYSNDYYARGFSFNTDGKYWDSWRDRYYGESIRPVW